MANVLILYDLMEPPVEMTSRFFEILSNTNQFDVSTVKSSNLHLKDLNLNQIIIVIRPQSMFLASVSSLVKKSGRVLITLYDDDILAIKDFHIRRWVEEKAIICSLRNTSVLFCTNDLLLEKYKLLGNIKRSVKIDTGVSVEEISCPKPSIYNDLNKLKVVYYCNDGTTNVFENIFNKVLPIISEYFRNQIDWVFIGTKPDIKNLIKEENLRFIDHLSLEDFRKELRTGGYSFGIAPLLDNEFSNHKYINKFMEFSTAGIPCIYSNVIPYKNFIRNYVDGVLCDNDAKSWLAAFEFLSISSNRLSIINNAQERLKKDFSVDSIFARIKEVVPEIIGNDYCNIINDIGFVDLIIARIKGYFFVIVDFICRVIGRLRVEGFKSLIKYSWQRIIGHDTV